MFSVFYQRYKLLFWGILTFAFLSGAISKSIHGAAWEVLLNGGLGVITLVVFLVLWRKEKKK